MSLIKSAVRALASISPKTAARVNRALADYAAASTTGKNQQWRPATKSGDAIIRYSGKTVRERIKDLERNNAHVQGAVRRLIANTVGEGNFPQSKVRRADGLGLDKRICDMIEQPFLRWAEDCCLNGDSLADLQGYNQRAKVVDGQAFVVVSQVKNVLRLQAIEADQLAAEVDGPMGDNGNYAVRGIEMDRFGRPVAYHFYEVHPGDNARFSRKINVIQAENVLHSFERNRASSSHGISIFATVCMNLFDINELSDTTLVLARLAAAYGIVIKTPSPEDFIQNSATGLDSGSLVSGQRYEYVNPGGFHYLRPEEDVSVVNPNQPGPQYEPFMRYNLRSAAVGVGQSYSQFSGDYSQGSYSSERQAMILERALFRMENAQMDRRFNIPLFRKWLDLEVLSGRIELPDYERNRWNYQRVKFSRPKMEYVNPLQEIQALILEKDNNMKSLTEIIEDRGMDRDDVFNTIKDDEDTLAALGINTDKGASNA